MPVCDEREEGALFYIRTSKHQHGCEAAARASVGECSQRAHLIRAKLFTDDLRRRRIEQGCNPGRCVTLLLARPDYYGLRILPGVRRTY